MELMVESEGSLQLSENQKVYELDSEENEEVRRVSEEKHGVDSKIINKTSNVRDNITLSNLNNGSLSEGDRKKSLEENGKIEYSPKKDDSIEKEENVNEYLTHPPKESEEVNDDKDISNTDKSNDDNCISKEEEEKNYIEDQKETNIIHEHDTSNDRNDKHNDDNINDKDDNDDGAHLNNIGDKNNFEEKENNRDDEGGEGGDKDISGDKDELKEGSKVEHNKEVDEDRIEEIDEDRIEEHGEDRIEEADEDQSRDQNGDKTEDKTENKMTELKEKNESKEDDLKLFDDTDLPLKAAKRDGRGKKKKSEGGAGSWDRVGKISGKIFDEEDDDDAYDYHNHYDYDGDDNEEYVSFKQASLGKKGDRVWMDMGRPGKKTKVDPLSQKLIKSPLVSEKKKSAESSKTGKCDKSKSQLQRKEVWLRGWEKKLRGMENEMEGRVAWVRRNEGCIMREERRLAEKEALLAFREQLLVNMPLDNEDGVRKVLEEAMERLRGYARWVDDQRGVATLVGGAKEENDGQVVGGTKVIDTLPFNNDDGGDVK